MCAYNLSEGLGGLPGLPPLIYATDIIVCVKLLQAVHIKPGNAQ